MIPDLANIPRVLQRELDGVSKRSEVNRSEPAGGKTVKSESSPAEAAQPVPVATSKVHLVEEYSAIINFEFVPSGKIHLNREAREHIIDFFE